MHRMNCELFVDLIPAFADLNTIIVIQTEKGISQMALVASRIEQYLDHRQIDYEVLEHKPVSSLQEAASSLAIAQESILRAVVLQADEQLTVAVLPLGRILDFKAMSQDTGRNFEPVSVASVAHIFKDCEAGVVPPLGSLYQLDTYCDAHVKNMHQVFFEAGSRRGLIRVNGRDFVTMIDQNAFLSLSRAQHELEHVQQGGQSSHLDDFVPAHANRDQLSKHYTLPPAPGLLKQLQQYDAKGSPDNSVLRTLLKDNSFVTERLMEMASGTFFLADNAHQVHSVDDMVDILGSELTVALAQGLVVWDHFELPPDGPLGKHSLLQHAVLSAQTSYRLVLACGGIADISPVLAAQMALLQHAGYMVLSRLFAPEYFLFNRMVQANPDVPVPLIEERLLAYGEARTLMQMGHAEVGAWLLKYWEFSPGLQQVCEYHHDGSHTGAFQHYVHLLILVNYLLSDIRQAGDAASTAYPHQSLSLLDINEESLEAFRKNLLEPFLLQQANDAV